MSLRRSWRKNASSYSCSILGRFGSGEESICATGDSGDDTQADD